MLHDLLVASAIGAVCFVLQMGLFMWGDRRRLRSENELLHEELGAERERRKQVEQEVFDLKRKLR